MRYEGRIIIIDASLEPENNSVVLAEVNSEFQLRRYKEISEHIMLEGLQPGIDPVLVTEEVEVRIIGVRTETLSALLSNRR